MIGRWLIPDPYREFWSPYVAFGNNPVNVVDPRGGFTDPKPGDLNEAGTQQWGLNGTTGEYGWSDILHEVVITTNDMVTQITYDGAKIAQFALSQERLYLRGDKSVSLKEIRPYSLDPTKGKTRYDCTGFIGYGLGTFYPSLAKKLDLGPTSNIEYWANRNGGIRKTNPKVGDIAIWKNHAEFVTSVHGTAFTTMGSSGQYGSEQPTAKSFGPGGKNNLKDYGNGTFLGFWTPTLQIK